MISVILLLMVSSQANADCFEDCVAEANYCSSVALQQANNCWNAVTQYYSQCMFVCECFNPPSYCLGYCGDITDQMFTQCQENYYDDMKDCNDDFNTCVSACY